MSCSKINIIYLFLPCPCPFFRNPVSVFMLNSTKDSRTTYQIPYKIDTAIDVYIDRATTTTNTSIAICVSIRSQVNQTISRGPSRDYYIGCDRCHDRPPLFGSTKHGSWAVRLRRLARGQMRVQH